MRTTVKIDPEMLAEAKALAAKSNRTLSDVIDDALRQSLARAKEAERAVGEFRLPVHGRGGLRPGVNLDDKQSLMEALGENDADAALRR